MSKRPQLKLPQPSQPSQAHKANHIRIINPDFVVSGNETLNYSELKTNQLL